MQEWRELVERIQDELHYLQDEVDAVSPLLKKLELIEPDEVEIRAVGATLHAFYGGVERILTIIAKRFDPPIADGRRWHRALLDQATTETEWRPRVISSGLHARLVEYLGFRHVFRHNYPGTLRWVQCGSLFRALGITCSQLEQEIAAFLENRVEQ